MSIIVPYHGFHLPLVFEVLGVRALAAQDHLHRFTKMQLILLHLLILGYSFLEPIQIEAISDVF